MTIQLKFKPFPESEPKTNALCLVWRLGEYDLHRYNPLNGHWYDTSGTCVDGMEDDEIHFAELPEWPE